MLGATKVYFSELIGTLAVILAVSAFIGSSELFSKLTDHINDWKRALFSGLLGGMIGIYGNLAGIEYRGAIISIRDIGPMLSGMIGGPFAGALGGLIAGVHRLSMGGITAEACVVATILIGSFCGMIAMRHKEAIERPWWACAIGVGMEIMHLTIVMIMVRPFDLAWDIVRQIAIPFILVNGIGFMLMSSIIAYTKKQRSMILEKNRLESELGVATVIQHSMLPEINSIYPGRKEVDVSASMEAAKEVGGDFYDLFFVDPQRIALVVGDVSGKGVPAALFMANSKIVMQNCVRDIPKLSDALAGVNQALCMKNEADMFLTAWVGILDLKTKELTYVSAGHNPPVFCHKDKIQLLKGKNSFILGGMEGMKYKENVMKMDEGDLLFIYTDGVVEAETTAHELFGEDRLLQCFRTYASRSASKSIDIVKDAVTDFVRGNSQFDDMTMLCMKVNPIIEEAETME